MTENLEKIRRVKEKYQKQWFQIPEVVAVGIGVTRNHETGLIVSVTRLTKQLKKSIPDLLEGIPVEIRISGEIVAQ